MLQEKSDNPTVMEWTEFVSFQDLNVTKRGEPPISAIYIWGFDDIHGGFVPYYIGKSINVHLRLFEHIGSQNGGLYAVYTEKYITSGRFKPAKAINEDLLYIPDGIPSFKERFRGNKIVEDTVDWMIDYMRITWAPTDPVHNDYLEKHVASILLKNGHYYSNMVRGASVNFAFELSVSFRGNERICPLLT